MVQVIELLNHRQRILSDKKIQLNCLTLFMENKTSLGVHFINNKRRHFKCQNMAFKWALIIMPDIFPNIYEIWHMIGN